RATEDDLRDRAPDVGERGPQLIFAQRWIRLPDQHRLVKPAAEQIAAELADLREVETKQLLARDRPGERALAVGDKAVHRDAHRVDQHAFSTKMSQTAEPCAAHAPNPFRSMEGGSVDELLDVPV